MSAGVIPRRGARAGAGPGTEPAPAHAAAPRAATHAAPAHATAPRAATHAAPRPMMVAYGILAVAATSRSVEQLATRAGEAPVAYGLSALSAVIYVVAWVALRRAPHGGASVRVARAACSVELVGVLLVGAASVLLPSTFAHPTVWSAFGVGYGFAPLVLPVAALWWLRTARAA